MAATRDRARTDRLAPETFRLPVERIRDGWYSDAYFVSTKRLLEEEGRHPRVLMQVFQKRESLLGGIDEAIAILKQCSGHRAPDGGWIDGWDEVEVHALHEGDPIAPHETVLTIAGDYSGGDTVAAARAFAAHAEPDVNVTVLVDFTNDSVGTALAVAKALGDRLWGVRLDTSEALVDRALQDEDGDERERRGVQPRLTADVVAVDGRPCAKTGRGTRPNPRLRRVE